MPQYSKAKPFDIVNTIKELQAAVKQLQVRSTGSATPWTLMTLQNSWAHATGDGLMYQLTARNSVRVVGRAVVPAGYTSGQIAGSVPYTPNRTEYCGAVYYSASSAESACLTAINASGSFFVYGAMVSGNTLVVNVEYPLDGLALP